MARARANDSQLNDFQEQPSKRACGKTSHGALKKTTDLKGDVVWYCPEDGCNYKENEEGERI